MVTAASTVLETIDKSFVSSFTHILFVLKYSDYVQTSRSYFPLQWPPVLVENPLEGGGLSPLIETVLENGTIEKSFVSSLTHILFVLKYSESTETTSPLQGVLDKDWRPL